MDRADYAIEKEVRRRFKLLKKAAVASKDKKEALIAEAVKIQEDLLVKGIQIEDSVLGTVWHRFVT